MGVSGNCVVLWCLFWCVWFVVYILWVAFGMSAVLFLVCRCACIYDVYCFEYVGVLSVGCRCFRFVCLCGVLVYMMCTVFSMSVFCLLVVGVFVLYVYVVGYMMCTVFSVLVFCLLCVGV